MTKALTLANTLHFKPQLSTLDSNGTDRAGRQARRLSSELHTQALSIEKKNI